MNPDQLVWLECRHTGCDSAISVDTRHVDNLTAAGGWECPTHESETPR